MHVCRSSSQPTAVPLLVCLCLLLLLSSAARAATSLPWENENSVTAALTLQDGQIVSIEGATVSRIEARNDPAFLVLEDAGRPDARVVVLCRPPVSLGRGQTVTVDGTVGTLPGSSERCINNPTIYGYFKDGRPQYWIPFFGLTLGYEKQALPIPTTPVPPSDPSLLDNGTGVVGSVSADTAEEALRFGTVASLLTTAPPVFSSVELSARPIVGLGAGFIVVGDDSGDSTVRIYTSNTAIRSTDRLIKATGVVHSENGTLVLYAGSGPSPFFDCQGLDAQGGVLVAGRGSVAYAGTLSDATTTQPAGAISGGASVMSVSPPPTSDGSWVYLTGQVITAVGKYYSYDISPNGWVYIYYIQGIDRTPGIRVLDPTGGPSGTSYAPGQIVDVMAKLNTKDGERLLGTTSTTDPSGYSYVECRLLDDTVMPFGSRLLPRPVGMNNRDLGGTNLGSYNPGVVGGQGLYDVGCYVTIWGKVLERGTYQFDGSGSYTVPYARIDDGSGVSSGNCSPSYGGPYGNTGAIVFGDSAAYNASVGACVSVTGPSSVWKPSGSTDTYRVIWTPNSPQQVSGNPSVSGTISGTVTLYDMATSSAEVTLYSTCGGIKALTVNRGTGNIGTASYSWSGVIPSFYLISAKCDGYKTRTYTNPQSWVNTGTEENPVWQLTRNIYLTPLRRVTVASQDNRNYIDPCSSASLNITATVIDDNHSPVAYPAAGSTVRFMTTAGSFNSTTFQQSITATTNASGVATVTLYGTRWSGTATVRATDDGTTPDYPNTSHIYVWSSTGSLLWGPSTNPASPQIDTNGNNTLSAADIDNRGGLEITAPSGNSQNMYAYGYNAAFKPLAGWPQLSPADPFDGAAAALGDANLDGSTKVVAADLSCAVTSWNATGTVLWNQVTGSPSVYIGNSSVALGDVNYGSDPSRIPDAVVGTVRSEPHRIWAFAGDEYHEYYPGYNVADGWIFPDDAFPSNPPFAVHSSPAIGDLDGDGHNEVAVGDDSGVLWIWSSSALSWQRHRVASGQVWSSPAIASLDGQPCVVFGSDDGRVYALHADGSPASGWPASGMRLDFSPRSSERIRTSPIIGDVMGDGNPQVVVGNDDGDVFVIWKDGCNHTSGPIAKVWTCAQTDGIAVDSTPAICSLNGSTVSLVVGSQDGIYLFGDLYSATFVANNDRWPWPTFHRDSARTGCITTPPSPISASIIGRARTSAGVGVPGVTVSIEYDIGGTGVPGVAGRPNETRADPVSTAGDATESNEVNEGGFVVNQLPVGSGIQYKLTFHRNGYADQYRYVTAATAGLKSVTDVVY